MVLYAGPGDPAAATYSNGFQGASGVKYSDGPDSLVHSSLYRGELMSAVLKPGNAQVRFEFFPLLYSNIGFLYTISGGYKGGAMGPMGRCNIYSYITA